MECIELVKEENGIVSIGGCKLGDKPSLFYDNMLHYSIDCKHLGQDLICCFIDFIIYQNIDFIKTIKTIEKFWDGFFK